MGVPEEVAEPTKRTRWYALVLKIEVSLCFKYITVQQAKDLMFLFPEEDEIRCLMLTTIFARILDLENFTVLLSCWSRKDKWNCMQGLVTSMFLAPAAERWYEFDLSKPTSAKCVVSSPNSPKRKRRKLARASQGKHEPWVDGWDQPDGWADDTTEDPRARKREAPDEELGTYGPPVEGLVDVEYYVSEKTGDAFPR